MARTATMPLSMQLGLRPVSVTWLFISLTLLLLPHLTRMPFWVFLSAAVFMAWRYLHEKRGWALPNRLLRLLLVVLLLLGIVASYGTLLGRGPSTAMLVVAMGLKFVELRTRRDLLIILFLAYFTVLTHFLEQQSLVMSVYMVVVVWMLTTALINFNYRGDVSRRGLIASSRLSLVLLLQAAPILLVLYVVFPRLTSPLWAIPTDNSSAVTGLDDEMSPGRISRLSQSAEVAFRVKFHGEVPAANLRYWRGPVFWDFDGTSWRPGKFFTPRVLSREEFGEAVDYTVTLEPSQKPWLPVLDLPSTLLLDKLPPIALLLTGRLPQRWLFTEDFQLQSDKLVSQRLQYRVISHPHYRTDYLYEPMRSRALQLPDGMGDDIYQLARQLRAQYHSDEAVVTGMLRYFREQPFYYTLNPPPLGAHHVEAFLFKTRRGFCEHYASSFTIVMRAAGIPARVVTGYQGGEMNPYGDYMVVRQSDAHAWSEVWLPEQGWVRVDPTAAVAPERITRGLESLSEFSITPRLLGQNNLLSRLWRTSSMSWDAVNNFWYQWVINYDYSAQQRLLARMGLDSSNGLHIALAILTGVGSVLVVVAIFMLWPRGAHDPVTRLYLKFCHRLAGVGLVRGANEGPLDFAGRVAGGRPRLATQAYLITRYYVALRYGRRPEDKAIFIQFRRAVRAFRAH